MSNDRGVFAGMDADARRRELDDAVELATRRSEVFGEANRRIDAITVTERSPDGAVEVAVGADGNVLGVRCTELVRAMPPHQLAAVFLRCAQTAQAGVADRVAETLLAVAPGDPLTDELVANARKAFPAPRPEQAPDASGPRYLDIGGIADDGPQGPRMTARRPVRPRPDDDPDDWAGRSVLS